MSMVLNFLSSWILTVFLVYLSCISNALHSFQFLSLLHDGWKHIYSCDVYFKMVSTKSLVCWPRNGREKQHYIKHNKRWKCRKNNQLWFVIMQSYKLWIEKLNELLVMVYKLGACDSQNPRSEGRRGNAGFISLSLWRRIRSGTNYTSRFREIHWISPASPIYQRKMVQEALKNPKNVI